MFRVLLLESFPPSRLEGDPLVEAVTHVIKHLIPSADLIPMFVWWMLAVFVMGLFWRVVQFCMVKLLRRIFSKRLQQLPPMEEPSVLDTVDIPLGVEGILENVVEKFGEGLTDGGGVEL